MKSNYCVCCGEEIPEGRMVCPVCESGNVKIPVQKKKKKDPDDYPSYEPSRYRRKQKYGKKK